MCARAPQRRRAARRRRASSAAWSGSALLRRRRATNWIELVPRQRQTRGEGPAWLGRAARTGTHPKSGGRLSPRISTLCSTHP
eukprot:scaffold4702_cov202-Prasinococcus_capsulatus_cf.AAC.1